MAVARCLLRGPLFVGGGAVEGGYGDVVEAKVDAELRGVVDEVIEEHLAVGLRARFVGDNLVAVAELPLAFKVSSEALTRDWRHLAAASSKLLESVFACGEFKRDMRAFGRGKVHAVVLEDVVSEEWKGGAVHGEFSESHGFVVTLPVVFAFGDALERAASVGDLDVVVLEEDFGDFHGNSFRLGVGCS